MRLPELPFSVEKAHLLVFVIVFFIALFAYDQSMPPVRVSTGAPLAVAGNSESRVNQTNASLGHVTGEVIYPEPNGTTEVPLEINTSAAAGNETMGVPVNGTIPINEAPQTNDTNYTYTTDTSPANESQRNETSEGELNESEGAPEEEDADNTPEETPDEPKGDVEVTYYFFWAEYCSTCKTMMPWIREVGRAHPSLNVEMIDLKSGSSYIQRFSVSSTAVSVIIKRMDGEDISGTKMIGFMDKDGIERLACSELDDKACDEKYPKK